MASQYGVTYKDYNREVANTRFDVTALNAGNLAAETVKHTALLAAIQAVSIGELQRERVVLTNTYSSSAPASSNLAQRENKWLCTGEDSTTHKTFRHEIPCADLTLLDANSEFMDLSADEGLALKTAFDDCVISPAGNASVLISVQFVGKRL
jgi:hypothetical protein